MRIAFIHDCIYPYRKGGGEVRIKYLSELLVKAGHEVVLVGMKDWQGPDVKVIKQGITAIGICEGLDLYTESGHRTISDALRFSRACTPKNLTDLVGRVDLIEANNIPYVHLWNVQNWAKEMDVPMLVTWHEFYGYEHWKTERTMPVAWGTTIFEKYTTTLGDGIIAVSERTKRRLIERGVKEYRISVVNGGIDVSHIAKTPLEGSNSDLFYAARLVGIKRVDLLLLATAISQKSLKRPLKVIITGDGPLKSELEALADNLGVDAEFTGFLPSLENVWGRMKKSKVMVHTSEREGFGFAALEAMACGLPVVTTDEDTTSINMFIDNGKNGYVCEPTPRSIADGIIKALNHADDMITNCKATASAFSWQQSAEELQRVYKAAV